MSGSIPPERTRPHRRADYPHLSAITTRWMDNDVYGHINNVVYYSFFDTAVNRYLVDAGCLDFVAGEIIGLVVETQCRYFSPIAFPALVTAGIRVAAIGTSSVRYEVGLFRDDADIASAQGHFVHVYVDRRANRPTPISAELRAALDPLQNFPRPD